MPIHGSTAHGQPWTHQAFMPHPLGATSPDLSGDAYRRAADARAALAGLDATARRLPNPQLFRHGSLRVEAQSTAALEGTYEPLPRVMSTDASDTLDGSMQEVLNFLTVANTAFAWNDQGRRWTVSAICELQRQLLVRTAGARDFGVRPIQVVVGSRPDAAGSHPVHDARYVPPPPGPHLEAGLADLLDWMQDDHGGEIDPVVAAAMVHYTFEALHPFHDGNGRIGRLLIVLHLLRVGVLHEPSISVSPWFERRRLEYYERLLGVSTRGDWSSWVEFFAAGLAASATDATTRMMALADVQSDLKRQVQESPLRSANAHRLVDLAIDQPIFTARQAADYLSVQPPGANKLIESLVGIGVLKPYGERSYGRQYHSPRVLRILLERNEGYDAAT